MSDIEELILGAEFGDKFITSGGECALFLRLCENNEYDFAEFYIRNWGIVKVFRESGKFAGTSADVNSVHDIVDLWKV